MIIIDDQIMIKRLRQYAYDTRQTIGKGTYGEVYLGIHHKTKEKVAIKVIKLDMMPESTRHLQTFRNEITNMQLVDNQHIVRLLNVQMSQKNLYLICEYCNGGNLQQYIKSKGRLSQQETLTFLGELLEGFKCLVSNHIVHRDFKPGNVMLHNYSAKIGDFGFSKVLDENCQLLISSVGTPQYMSPQILSGDKYTMKTDIWSLGIVMYQMLYGRTPWSSSNNAKIQIKLFELRNTISLQPLKFPDYPKVSEQTKQMIRRMLRISQQQRIGWQQLFQLKFKKEYNLKEQLNEIVLESKQLQFQKVRSFARLYFEFNKSIQDAHQILKNQNQNAHFFNSHNISMVSYITQNSHLEQDFRKYNQTKRSKAVVDKIQCMFLNRRNFAVLFVSFYFRLLDFLQQKLFEETLLIETCMFLYLKESFILLFQNYKLLNTQSPDSNKFSLFVETQEGQLVQVLSRYDNTIISMLFNSVLPQFSVKLQQASWISQISHLLNVQYQNNLTPIIKKYTQHMLAYFKGIIGRAQLNSRVVKQLLVLMRMMNQYFNETYNAASETFNLVMFQQDIQKQDIQTLKSKLGIISNYVNSIGVMGTGVNLFAMNMSMKLNKQK